MAYTLQAAIAGDELLRAASRDVPGTHVVPFLQGLSLLPMTDAAFDAVTDGGATGALGFWKLPGGFEGLLAQWSAAGPVATSRRSISEASASSAPRSGSAALWPWGPWRHPRGADRTPSALSHRHFGGSVRAGASGRTSSRPSGWTGTVTPTTGSRPVRGDAGPARRLAPASQPSGLSRIALRWLNVSIE